MPPSVTPTTPPAYQSAAFRYDGDGKRVKSTINGNTTTYFVGAHYEVSGSTNTKYYYAGAQRIAMRTSGTLNYLLGDHLGSTSLTTDAAGNKISEVRYCEASLWDKAWGEVRYAWGNITTKYQYTGQFSYEQEFGLYFYNARIRGGPLQPLSAPEPSSILSVTKWARHLSGQVGTYPCWSFARL
jgi:hypothetical protein